MHDKKMQRLCIMLNAQDTFHMQAQTQSTAYYGSQSHWNGVQCEQVIAIANEVTCSSIELIGVQLGIHLKSCVLSYFVVFEMIWMQMNVLSRLRIAGATN